MLAIKLTTKILLYCQTMPCMLNDQSRLFYCRLCRSHLIQLTKKISVWAILPKLFTLSKYNRGIGKIDGFRWLNTVQLHYIVQNKVNW